ncbi:prealbumin-like fold domain-containing protein [Corynebacterium accolens]|uniref:prealbumin-like fold domain-containing protein n=1 Tax=Corynebacterium accolens TaxID=38284 RepID=UPI00266F52C2|nr:prealbumin-like fold domain-containing protein [Corynebacterium accolens]WKS56636.1 prealbumin-like fold domain-containing protein [Corynebacterium accolens]
MVNVFFSSQNSKQKGVGPVRFGRSLKVAAAAMAGAVTLTFAPLAVGQDDTAGHTAANDAIEADTATSAIDEPKLPDDNGVDDFGVSDTPPANPAEEAGSEEADSTADFDLPDFGVGSPVQEDSLDIEQLSESTFKLSLSTEKLSGDPEYGVPVVTLERENSDMDEVDPRRAELSGEDKPRAVETAFAPATTERGYDVVSFDLHGLSADKGDVVSFVYSVDRDDLNLDSEKKAWELAAKGSENAFVLGQTLSEAQPRSAMSRAAASPKAPDLPPQLGKIGIVGPYPGGETGMNNDRYYGPLSDPDFGQQFEQNPGNFTYNDKTYTYPIRHRNWSAREYETKPNRPLRGPSIPHGGSGGGNDTPTYRENEQGLFFSRDHVQYAWPESNAVYRGDEFLLGGGASGGVWYGGMYALPTGTSIDWNANYRGTGKPGFKLFIDGQLNIDDSGWQVQKQPVNGVNGFNYVSPDRELLIRIDQRSGGKSFNITFLDLKKLMADNKFNNNGIDVRGNLRLRDYRVGISTPGWKRVFIGAGTTENSRTIKSVNSANGYLYSQFLPEFGSAPTPDIRKKVVPASPQTSWGEEETTDSNGERRTSKYIDYQIDMVVPANGPEKTFYKLHEKPNFDPRIKITDMKLVEAQNKRLEDFRLVKKGSSPSTPKFDIVNRDVRSTSARPELGENDYLEIWKGQTHSVTVRMYFETDSTQALGTGQTCRSGDGLYNKAELEIAGENSRPEADACATYYQPSITKKVKPQSADQAWGTLDNGKKFIDYDIAVTTPASPRHEYFYKLMEKPDFGPSMAVEDLQIQAVEGKSKDEFLVNKLPDTGGKATYEIVNRESRTVNYAPHLGNQNFLEIWDGQTHKISVRVIFSTSVESKTGTGKCGPGQGLYNSATLTVADLPSEFKDADCAPYNKVIPATAGIMKMDEKGNFLPLGHDFAFDIVDDFGNRIPFSRETKANAGNGDFVIKGTKGGALEVGKQYYLVETKAPEGFELLAQRVGFKILEKPGGGYELKIDNHDHHPQVLVANLGNFSLGQNSVYFAVSDMRQGDMPEAGGRGVGWKLGGGLVLLLLAAFATRRLA